jgi:CheY-like chemotaxis protein
MNLTAQLTTLQERTRGLNLGERAQVCCELARELERAGEYEAASEALSEFWPERGGSPMLEGLDRVTAAQVLLRVGALAGWLGSAHQAEQSQETAKDLITRSIEIFSELGQSQSTAEAHADLALCYWREGAFDEARIHLNDALTSLKNEESDLKACVLIRAGMVEVKAGRWNAALRLYEESSSLVDQSTEHSLKGTLHNSLGAVLCRLAAAENREDYRDRAFIEYTAASFHFDQAGHVRYRARVENNLGYLFFTVSRFSEAYVHLDNAHGLFFELGDIGAAAGVHETRARTLLAEGRLQEAEKFARLSVKTLEKGGEQALLAEALTTHGTALARLGHYSRSKALLERAIEVAETAGDLEGAGRAQLTVIEELSGQISAKELIPIYRSAIEFLKDSEDPSTGQRLIGCATKLLDALGHLESGANESKEQSWEGFSFKEHVRKSEREVIKRALRDAEGLVTPAARLLGFKHHQSLISLINTRHKDLEPARSTVRKRRRHIFSESRKIQKRGVKAVPRQASSQISILHVEDNEAVARLVADTLTNEGTHLDSCMSGATALKILKGNAHYDLIIVDSDLPGLNGLELARRTRSIAHRRGTPIIMLSGDDCEKEAWRVGVDAFLRKPEAVEQLSLTIARVLEERGERGN